MSSYEDSIDDWLADAIQAVGVNFPDLLCHLPGVDPIVLLSYLKSERCLLPPSDISALLKQVDGPISTNESYYPAPVPHPLDFDWRYGLRAQETLLSICSEEVPEGGKIALIGAPTMAPLLSFLKNSWDIHLIDRNPSWKNVSSGVTTHTADIYESEPPADLLGSVHLVVADPPWYLESYAHFLWFSARLLIPEGKLALSLLPKGTRPSAPTDRKKIYDKAAQMGLNFQSEHSRSLSYASPPFERNAFRAAGIETELGDWRHADLWIFGNAGKDQVVRPAVIKEQFWSELAFENVRVRFNSQYEEGSVMLEPLVVGDILPSVSAREAIRSRASVWTSGNRIYSCSNAANLYDICVATSWSRDGGFCMDNLNYDESQALTLLHSILSVELQEYGPDLAKR